MNELGENAIFTLKLTFENNLNVNLLNILGETIRIQLWDCLGTMNNSIASDDEHE